MEEEPIAFEQPEIASKKRSLGQRLALLVLAAVLLYLVVAYLVMPGIWLRYARWHPALQVPGITHTRDGIPGDPLNVALVGSEAEVNSIMAAAGWNSADRLGLRSDVEIAADTVLDRPDDRAPVSNLYLFGRKEDLAFEQPVGDSPRKRNHVRFWRTPEADPDGRPVWIGSATYDERVGLSHTTGEITHHISGDVDAERDHLFQSLEKTGDLSDTHVIAGFHKVLQGRNGGGDPWHTDGNLTVGTIRTTASSD